MTTPGRHRAPPPPAADLRRRAINTLTVAALALTVASVVGIARAVAPVGTATTVPTIDAPTPQHADGHRPIHRATTPPVVAEPPVTAPTLPVDPPQAHEAAEPQPSPPRPAPAPQPPEQPADRPPAEPAPVETAPPADDPPPDPPADPVVVDPPTPPVGEPPPDPPATADPQPLPDPVDVTEEVIP